MLPSHQPSDGAGRLLSVPSVDCVQSLYDLYDDILQVVIRYRDAMRGLARWVSQAGCVTHQMWEICVRSNPFHNGRSRLGNEHDVSEA